MTTSRRRKHVLYVSIFLQNVIELIHHQGFLGVFPTSLGSHSLDGDSHGAYSHWKPAVILWIPRLAQAASNAAPICEQLRCGLLCPCMNANMRVAHLGVEGTATVASAADVGASERSSTVQTSCWASPSCIWSTSNTECRRLMAALVSARQFAVRHTTSHTSHVPQYRAHI